MQVREAMVVVVVMLATCGAAVGQAVGQTPLHTILYNPPADGAPPEDILQMIRQSQNPHFQARNAEHVFSFIRHDAVPHHTLGSVPSSPQTSVGDPLETQTSVGGPLETQTSAGDPVETQTSAGDPLGTQTSAGDPLGTQTSAGDPLETKTSDGALPETHTAVDDLPEFQSSSGDLLGTHTSRADLPEARSSAGDYSGTQTHTYDIMGAKPFAYLSGARTSAGDLPETQTSAGVLPDTQKSAGTLPYSQTSAGALPDTQTSAGALPDIQTSAGALPDTQTSAGALPDTQTSAGAFPGTQTSAGALPDTQASAGALPDTQKSAGALPDTQTSAGVIPDTQTSAGAFPDTQTSAGALPDTQTSAGAIPDTQTSAGAIPDTQTSAGAIPDTQTSAGDLPGTLTFLKERLGNETSSGGPLDNKTSADEISDTESTAVDLLGTATSASDFPGTKTTPDDPLGTQMFDGEFLGAQPSLDDVINTQASASDLQDTQTSDSVLQDTQTSASDLQDTQTSVSDLRDTQTSASVLKDTQTSASDLQDTQTSDSVLQDTQTSASDLQDTQTSVSDIRDTQTSVSVLKDTQTSASVLQDTQTSASDLQDTQTSVSDLRDTQTSSSDLQDTQASASDLQDTQASASDLQDTQASASDLGTGSSAIELPETQTILNDITQTQTYANDLNAHTSLDDLSDTKTSASILLDIQTTKSDFLDMSSLGYVPTYFETVDEVSSDVSHIPDSHSDTQTSVDELENPASGPLLLTTEVFHPSTTLGEFPDADELFQTTTLPPADTTAAEVAALTTTTHGTSEIMKGKDKETKKIREKPNVKKDSVDHMQNTLNFAFEKVKRKPEPSDVPLGRSVDSRTHSFADYPAEHRGGQNNMYQYHFQDHEAGSYKFGFGGENQWRHEERRPDGVVVGRYGWHDATGKHHVTHYVSDAWGYRVVKPGDKVLLHAPDPPITNDTQTPTTPTHPPSTNPSPTAIAYSVLKTLMPTNPPPTATTYSSLMTSTPTDPAPTANAYSSEITSLPTSPSSTTREPATLPSSQQQLSESYPGKPEDMVRPPPLPASMFMGRPPIAYPLPQQQSGSERPDSWLVLSPTPSPSLLWSRPRPVQLSARPNQSNRPITSPFRPVNQPRPQLFRPPKPLKPLLSYLSLPRPKPGQPPKPTDKSPSEAVQASDEILKPGSSETVSDSLEFVHHYRPKKPLHSSKPIKNPYRPITWPRPHLHQPVRLRPPPPPASGESDGSASEPPPVSPTVSPHDDDDDQKEVSQSESTDFTDNLVSHQESIGYLPTGRPSHQPGHQLGSVVRRPQPHPAQGSAQAGRPTLYAPATSLTLPGLGVNNSPQDNRPLSPVPGSSSVAGLPEAQSSPSQSVVYAVSHGGQIPGQQDPQKHPLDYAFMDEDYNLLEDSSAVSDNTDDKVQLQQSTEENADDLRSQIATKDDGVPTNENVASEEGSQKVAAVDSIGQDTITRPTAGDYSTTSSEAGTTTDLSAATTDHSLGFDQDSGGHQEHILVTSTDLSTPDDGVTQYATTSMEVLSSTAEEPTSEAPYTSSTPWDSLTTDTEWPYLFQQPSTTSEPEPATFPPPLSPQNFWTDLLQQIYNLPNLVPERIRPTLQ